MSQAASLAGIKQNKQKSGWIKREGKWLKPLRFLGMTYDPFQGVFKASTRSGAELEFETPVKFILWLEKHWKGTNDLPIDKKPSLKQNRTPSYRQLWEEFREEYRASHNWQELFQSKFIGFVFSRLQADD